MFNWKKNPTSEKKCPDLEIQGVLKKTRDLEDYFGTFNRHLIKKIKSLNLTKYV